jgi:signal transduction histidine kinase
LANRAFAAFVNRPKAILKGNFFEALFDLCWNSNAVSAALEGVFLGGRELQNYEFQAEPHGRGRRILLMNARRLLPKGDAAAGILVALEDITERRRAEETLRDTNLQLEQRVTERTEDLQRSYEQMESFCYSIAHDLRAPLRSICGFSELLGIQFGEAIGAAGKEHTERIRQSAEHMDQLIQDLLNYGRLNTASLALGDVNLEEVFAQVLALLEKEIGEKRATVQKEGALPHVRGHQVVLQVMLTNLISNALKFVAPGVPPKVLIRSEDKGERARLWIEDNGIGIAPENRERIFGVFQRLHTSQSYPGTGIGLAIVSKGVERMRGRAGVESEPGKGSRFWIELQKASAPNERVAESVGKHAPGKQPPLPGMTPEEMRALSDQAERNGEPRAQVANPHIIPFPKKKSETRAEQKKRAS